MNNIVQNCEEESQSKEQQTQTNTQNYIDSSKPIKNISKLFGIKYLADMSGVTSLQDYGGVRSMLALSENIIITGSYDGSLFICSLDLLSKKYNITFNQIRAHEEIISYLSKTDNKQIISSSYDKTIKIWDILDGNKLKLNKIVTKHSSSVMQAIYIGYERIASCSTDLVIIWKQHSLRSIMEFIQDYKDLTAILYLPKKDFFLISNRGRNNDGIINVWDLNSPYKPMKVINNIYAYYVNCMIELYNGNIAITHGKNSDIYILNSNNFETINIINLPRNFPKLYTVSKNSFFAVDWGVVYQLLTDDGINYKIVFQDKTSIEELYGLGGVIVLENGNYFVTDGKLIHGVNIFKCEYEK